MLLLSSPIYFFLAYVGYKEQNINLKDCDVSESVIIDKGIDYRHGTKGPARCFYILLEGSEKKLGVYRMLKDYQDLLVKFNIGDTVTAYFRDNNNSSEHINIDLVQVERNGQILLNKKEYERKESSLICIGLFGGLMSITASYLYYKKYRLETKRRISTKH